MTMCVGAHGVPCPHSNVESLKCFKCSLAQRTTTGVHFRLVVRFYELLGCIKKYASLGSFPSVNYTDVLAYSSGKLRRCIKRLKHRLPPRQRASTAGQRITKALCNLHCQLGLQALSFNGKLIAERVDVPYGLDQCQNFDRDLFWWDIGLLHLRVRPTNRLARRLEKLLNALDYGWETSGWEFTSYDPAESPSPLNFLTDTDDE